MQHPYSLYVFLLQINSRALMKQSLKARDSGQPNHRWLVSLCAMAMLAWTAQFAADWYKPHSDIGLSQLKKMELAHTIEHERPERSRTTRVESKPDPIALP
ncbi:MAG TPA: hypothetical protein VFG52_08850, partial [Xanthomonadales bacterium]|nr:hypothetical protein [Xanthomonadales bacterium]